MCPLGRFVAFKFLDGYMIMLFYFLYAIACIKTVKDIIILAM